MSIVALLCECESLSLGLIWCIVFTETIQCTLGILERDYVATFFFSFCFVLGVTQTGLTTPVRKALLIIPAEVGCVCEHARLK